MPVVRVNKKHMRKPWKASASGLPLKQWCRNIRVSFQDLEAWDWWIDGVKLGIEEASGKSRLGTEGQINEQVVRSTDGSVIRAGHLKERVHHSLQQKNRVLGLHKLHMRHIRCSKRNIDTVGQKLHLSDVDGLVFLEQTSWSNFNEGNDLPEVVKACHQRSGFYPEAVLADQIYRTRANLAYCKACGIRLSGKPMGRRKKDPKENAKVRRQTYKDSCDRNGIEGDNGPLKTHYEMDCVMSRLPETSETEVAFEILAMNAETLCRCGRDKAEGKTKGKARANPLPDPERIHRHAGSLC